MRSDPLKRLAWLYGVAKRGSLQEERARLALLLAASQALAGHPVGTDYDAQSEVRRVMSHPSCGVSNTVLRGNGTR